MTAPADPPKPRVDRRTLAWVLPAAVLLIGIGVVVSLLVAQSGPRPGGTPRETAAALVQALNTKDDAALPGLMCPAKRAEIEANAIGAGTLRMMVDLAADVRLDAVEQLDDSIATAAISNESVADQRTRQAITLKRAGDVWLWCD